MPAKGVGGLRINSIKKNKQQVTTMRKEYKTLSMTVFAQDAPILLAGSDRNVDVVNTPNGGEMQSRDLDFDFEEEVDDEDL